MGAETPIQRCFKQLCSVRYYTSGLARRVGGWRMTGSQTKGTGGRRTRTRRRGATRLSHSFMIMVVMWIGTFVRQKAVTIALREDCASAQPVTADCHRRVGGWRMTGSPTKGTGGRRTRLRRRPGATRRKTALWCWR